jgi:allantoinase
LDYVVDWSADDLPFPLRVNKGRLLAMPYSGITDMSAFAQWHWTGEQFYQLIRDQFDMLYEEGKTRPRALSIALHPFLSGRPHRSLWLDKALAYVTEHDHLWLATGGEIASWYFEHYSQNPG